jgi:5-methylcytosine-specific restriction endonuclease McrA
MYELSQQVLRTDVAGMPLEWIGYQDAARLHHQQQVAYSCGTHLYDIRGGYNAVTGLRSIISISSIVATYGAHQGWLKGRVEYIPPLNNPALFRRDAYLCMYCGLRLPPSDLSRDHVTPLSRGGRDCWSNVVTAWLCSRFRSPRLTLSTSIFRAGRCSRINWSFCWRIFPERAPFKPGWGKRRELAWRSVLTSGAGRGVHYGLSRTRR